MMIKYFDCLKIEFMKMKLVPFVLMLISLIT